MLGVVVPKEEDDNEALPPAAMHIPAPSPLESVTLLPSKMQETPKSVPPEPTYTPPPYMFVGSFVIVRVWVRAREKFLKECKKVLIRVRKRR